jgi:glycosyltransferase involved in cell wall biosynthesis
VTGQVGATRGAVLGLTDSASRRRSGSPNPLLPLSFVVIAYNEATRIEATLRSVQHLADLPAYEIIVVDDGSTDTTVEVLQRIAENLPQLKIVPLEANRGRGAARAAGVNVAAGEYVAMIDADILLPPDWWVACRQAIADHDVVSGTAVPDGDVVYLAERFGLTPKVVAQATTTTGSNALFRRTVFERVSYDEQLRNGEDVALDHAMVAAGIRAFVVPELTVQHREDKTFSQTAVWLFESGVGAARQFERYHKVRRPDQASALLTLLLANAVFSPRQRRTASVAALVFGLAATAALHVRGKFRFSADGRSRYAFAVAADMVLLAAYCGGRIVGHGYVCRREN